MANELDEITGPINPAGNSKSNLTNFFGSTGLKTASKSFGIVGSAALKRSNAPITIVIASNNNEPVTSQETNINKPLVKMIGVLASIDGVLKQRIENQKVIARNEQLAAREGIIESRNAEPHIEVIKPDAEKTSGSAAGLLALGGLALLTLDPVQDALKAVIDGVVATGSFVTSMVSSLNDVFRFLLGSNQPAIEPPSSDTPQPGGQPGSAEQTRENQQEPAPPPEPEEQALAQTAPTGGALVPGSEEMATAIFNRPEESAPTPVAETPVTPTTPITPPAPTFTQRVKTAAVTTAITSPILGPTIAAGIAAYNFFSGRNESNTTTPAAPTGEQAQAVGIPRNDSDDRGAIVRLGQYLQSQGINVSEHPDFGSGRVGDHATNSRHYRGLAIDLNVSGAREAEIFDALEPQLRAAGYNTIWRAPGHEGHMHVSVGGPEGGGAGGGDYAGMAGTISSIASASVETIGKLFGAIGSVLVKPGIPRTDVGRIIGEAAVEYGSSVATRSETPPSTPGVATQPSVDSASSGGAPQGNVVVANRNNIYYYLRRFGYQNLSTPEASLMRNTVVA